MNRFTCSFVLVLFLTGCPTQDRIQHSRDAGRDHQPTVDAAKEHASDADAIRHDASGDRGQDLPPEPNSVSIISPTTTTYTNGTVDIAVSTQRPVSLPIAIYADSTEVGTIAPPATTFAWSTVRMPEKAYSVTAQIVWNGETLTSSPVMVIVDRTAPTITRITPAPGSTNVVLASPISISISEPLSSTTVTAAFVSVTAGGVTVPTTLSLDAAGQVITVGVTSSAGVVLPQTFTATLAPAAVTDLAGNALAVSSPSWTWMVPDWIQLPPFPSYSAPVLAVSPDFHAGIVYTQCPTIPNSSGCSPELHVAENDGQGWNDLGQPGNATGGGSLAFDSKGRTVVSWGGVEGSSAAASVATWNGAAWDLSLPPIDVPGDDVAATTLRLDAMDRPFLAFRREASTNSDIYVAHWTGTAWDKSFGNLGLTSVGAFDLLLTAQGAPLVGVQDASGSDGLYEWTGTVWMQAPRFEVSAPSVALDATGNPSMISNWLVEHLTSGSWLPLTSLLTHSATANYPRLVAAPGHLFALAWWDDSPPPAGIGLARWTGSAWDRRPGIARAGGGDAAALAPSLVVDGRGAMWIAWFDGSTSYVWMSNY